MALTNAERQARHRERLKREATASIEEHVESLRQEMLAGRLKDAEEDGKRELADELRYFMAEPPLRGEAIKLWLAQLVEEQLDSDYEEFWAPILKDAERRLRKRPLRNASSASADLTGGV